MIMTIQMNTMQFYAYHGVLPQENTVGANYEVDLTLQIKVDEAAYLHDQLSGTVNYAEVFEAVHTEMKQPSRLLEHLVHRINTRLLQNFSRIITVETKITKIAPPIPGATLYGCSVCAKQKSTSLQIQ